jgi:hypothetical protein
MFSPIQSKRHYYLLLGFLLVISAGLYYYTLPRASLTTINDQSYNRYRCNTGNQHNSSGFKLLLPAFGLAKLLSDSLCQQPYMREHYAYIEAHWFARSDINARLLLDGDFDLVWIRKHVLTGLVANAKDYFQEIATLPRYCVFWISHNDKPQLTQAYFSNRTIGLLDTPQSYSGYQLPMESLKQAGITLLPDQLRYFPTRHALLKAQQTGSVDVIPGLHLDSDLNTIPEEHRLLIRAGVSAGGWYLKTEINDERHRCAVYDAIYTTKDILSKVSGGPIELPRCAS